MNLPLVIIYRFYEKKIQIHSSGEPGEQHLGEVRQGTLKPPGEPQEHRLGEVLQGKIKI